MRWRQALLRLGGAPGALDWLLDAAAGVSTDRWPGSRLAPVASLTLTCSRQEIERLWRVHLAEAVPLQYLVGRCFWREFALEVGPGALIPRPETELLIDLARALLPASPGRSAPPLLWADLGTGSGCLAMGLARAFPHSHGLAVDLSSAALQQAQRNLTRADLNARVRLIEGHWFAALEPWWGGLQLVLANPPYIPSDVVEGLDPVVRDHEPRLALDGGVDGLASIRCIARDAAMALAPGGWLLLEHHHDQSERVRRLLAAHGLVHIHSHADLEGHLRFVSGRRPATAGSPLAGVDP